MTSKNGHLPVEGMTKKGSPKNGRGQLPEAARYLCCKVLYTVVLLYTEAKIREVGH